MVLETSFVTLSTGPTLSLAEQGDPAGPALVLLPGPTDSWSSYEVILDLIPTEIRAIAVSPRGHGDSHKPATGYRVPDFASDVVPLLDAVGVDRAVLAGHSGSCFITRRVAIDAPERVAGLVLEASPTTLHGDPAIRDLVESTISGLQDPLPFEFARSFVADTSSSNISPELIDRLAADLVKVPARVWREMFDGLLQYDDLTELAGLTTPSLLIWGDADGLVDRDMQDQLLARMPNADLLVYGGVGHTPRWEDADRFASDVAAFVRRAIPRSS